MKVKWVTFFLTAVLKTQVCEAKDTGSESLTEAEMDVSAHMPELGEVYSHRNLSEDLQIIKDFHKTSSRDCNTRTRYYSLDGWCNNLQHHQWGATFQPFVRLLPNQYSDGKVVPRVYSEGSGEPLTSTRLVSTECMPCVRNETMEDVSRIHSQMLMQFGQFQSHDTGATPALEGADCCKGLNKDGFHPDMYNRGPCFPIPVPEHDRYFNRCIPFTRSLFVLDENVKYGGRCENGADACDMVVGVAQQINSATSFVDASVVYGSSLKASNALRAWTRGDMRVNVFPGLTAMHLLWHREHNRLADMLRSRHDDWDDERLFQEARRILIAEMQSVVYGEYLPIILGPWVTNFFRLNSPAKYNPNLNPTTINSFTTTAYRFGHSQINNEFLVQHGGFAVPIKSMYFRPDLVYNQGEETLTGLLICLLNKAGQKSDDRFSEGVSDFLFFGVDRPGASSDLMARNMQRGRDHGLPPYYQYMIQRMEAFGVSRFRSRLRLSSCVDKVYRSLRDVDLFLGGMEEKLVRGGEVGPTFAYIIGKQFQNFREGDRFFYDIQGSAAGFTEGKG
ncbi:hypothetical protein C0Q70_02955 [Pomacea canaliculata]|uniref:Uncharacterized protein n=1 Tax=Pomacea canaliculata TaxID=400727 RepID=A0A2T7PRE3_POMCA|nr:hypothetical protein C0Q70_02955 [Pomacea canaliculata]